MQKLYNKQADNISEGKKLDPLHKTKAIFKKVRIAEEPIKTASTVLLEKPTNVANTDRKVVFEQPIEIPGPEIAPDRVEPSKEIKEWSELQKSAVHV